MSNRLANESSPYLLQHAGNPVDWYPWGEEALKRAKSENKPILLSIGYSACHWCHVMAHESFENESIASLMNQNFINIKVDREERPDLDHIYMEAVQAMTGGGGWPLTVFLTPELNPFYGGTYFPPQDRKNLPGFSRVLTTVSKAYLNRRSEIEQTAGQMAAMLKNVAKNSLTSEDLNEEILKQAFSSLQNQFDPENGGFGEAPKFPNPLALEYLLRYYSRTRDSAALKMVEFTLDKMGEGGIYDQIGGGFHRYATDKAWQVPHFEKMLYDNALLCRVYLHAYLVTQNKMFAAIAEEILDYVLREMTSPEGGFYGTQDADSEGEEGKYYLWTADEVNETIGIEAGSKASSYFGVSLEGNFDGRNILHRTQVEEAPEFIRNAKKSLLKRREKRVKPSRDEKIIASWNGLMLSAFAEAASILDRQDYKSAALKNGAFLLRSIVVDDKVHHVYKDGRVKVEGFLEDYAQIIEGLLLLHEATLEGKWLSSALKLGETMLESFSNKQTGILSDTIDDRNDLIIRPRNDYDGAVPSAASIAARVLQKIALISGNPLYGQIAGKELNSVRTSMMQYPLGYCSWLCDLDFFLSSPKEIAVIGSLNNAGSSELMRVINSKWIPNKVLVGLNPTDPESFKNTPLLNDRPMINGQPTIYICQNNTCQAPIIDAIMLNKVLG